MTAAAIDTTNEQHVEINPEDLPLYCPGPRAPLWSMHPRVFLDMAHSGYAKCPYCGTEYRFKDGVIAHGHGH